MCSMGGWLTVREREYEDGFQEKAFWQWDLKQEARATRTQTTWKFQACFWVLNQWEPFLGAEWKGSTRHSEESLHLGQWMPQWTSAPYLSFPTCRENPISCTFFSYFRFWLLLDTFGLFDCHEQWQLFHMAVSMIVFSERESSARLLDWESGGAQARFILSFLLLCLTCGSIFTLSCPNVS